MSMHYKGIEDVLKDQYHKGVLTVDFQAMLDMSSCPCCSGSRLRQESLNVFLSMKDKPYNIAAIHDMTLGQLVEFFVQYRDVSDKPEALIQRITKPLIDRLETITGLGLHYLNLSRGVKTLSGGEMQRLRLAKQLGNKLTGIMYVLDEPTIGLSSVEIDKMIEAIRKLQQMGNSIVVVEHHDRFIRASDWVAEIGPNAGDFGGHVVFNGPYDKFIKSDALTAQYMRGEKKVDVEFTHEPSTKMLSVKKASKYNLKDVDVELPLG